MVKVAQADIDREERLQRTMIHPVTMGHDREVLQQAFAAHRIATIEECAKVAESDNMFAETNVGIADAIRAMKEEG